MSNTNPSNNPFEPPQSELVSDQADVGLSLRFPLGIVFWGWMLVTLLVCIVLSVTPLAGLGIVGCGATVLAIARGVAYGQRVTSRRMLPLYENLRQQPFLFYVTCMALAVPITIACLVAFVCCCVPLSIPLYNYSAGGGTTNSGIGAVAVFSGLIAMGVGLLLVRLTLPR